MNSLYTTFLLPKSLVEWNVHTTVYSIFVVADNGKANIIAIPSVNAAAIPKVKSS